MGDFSLSDLIVSPKQTLRRPLDPAGLFRKPKVPPPTAEELELRRRQRKELDELTRESNQRLKSIKRGRVGRRTLLGSGSELGIQRGLGSGGVRSRAPSASRPGGSATAGAGAKRSRAGILSFGTTGFF